MEDLEIESYETPVDATFDHMYKVLLVGNSRVGKTAFLLRYCDDYFSQSLMATVGIDFKVKTIYRDNKRIKLQLWDTAGQERYRTITTAYYRGAMGFILMFDLTNEESFLAVKSWATTINDLSWEDIRIVLVGNKSDLTDSRVVTEEQCRDLSQSLGFQFFETSAKDGYNVKNTFECLVDAILEKIAESIERDPKFLTQGTRPKTLNTSAQSSGSCAC